MSDICWVSIQSSWYYCKITAANSWKTPFRIIFMSWLILSWNHDFTTVNFFLRKRFRISSQPCHHRTVLRQNLHFKNLVTDIKVNCHLKWKSWNVVSFAPTHHRSYVIFLAAMSSSNSDIVTHFVSPSPYFSFLLNDSQRNKTHIICILFFPIFIGFIPSTVSFSCDVLVSPNISTNTLVGLGLSQVVASFAISDNRMKFWETSSDTSNIDNNHVQAYIDNITYNLQLCSFKEIIHCVRSFEKKLSHHRLFSFSLSLKGTSVENNDF